MPQVDANFARGVCGESVKAAPSLGSANVPITSRPFVSPLYVDGRSVKKAIPEQLLAVSTISRSSCGLQLEAQRPPRGTIAPTRSTVINNYGEGPTREFRESAVGMGFPGSVDPHSVGGS